MTLLKFSQVPSETLRYLVGVGKDLCRDNASTTLCANTIAVKVCIGLRREKDEKTEDEKEQERILHFIYTDKKVYTYIFWRLGLGFSSRLSLLEFIRETPSRASSLVNSCFLTSSQLRRRFACAILHLVTRFSIDPPKD